MYRKVVLTLALLLVAWSFAKSPERAAYDKAKTLIDEKYRTHVLSIYGKGSMTEIQTWHFNFYDPSSPTRAKAVVMKDGKVDLLKPAEWGKPYDDSRSFDPVQNKVGVDAALKTAKEYAATNNVAYDGVTVLLRRPNADSPPSWSVGFLHEGRSRGYVLTKVEDGSFSSFQTRSTGSSGAEGFAKDVEDTFLGIGGDMEEFFTGKRTVDR